MALQRLDAWIHFSWFAQANWSALQVTRWTKKNHTNRDQSLTRTICFLHYHLDCRGYVISHARAVSIANLVMIRKGSSQLLDFFCLYTCIYICIYIYIYIYIHFFKLTLCSNISSEIAFDNFSLHSHQLPYWLRDSFPWFSFFSLEGTNEDLEWALLDIFTSYIILWVCFIAKGFSLYVQTYMHFFMTFFYKAIPRGELLCLCSVHLPITRVRLSFYIYLMP